VAVDASGQRVYRIMPVGDSITEGGTGFVSYRYLLWEKLFAAGYLIEYVGSQTNESRIGPLRHEGYRGRNAEFLAATVPQHFQQTLADVVLLHAGHNHTSEERPVAKIITATESLIGAFRSINPQVAVLLAQVIPSGKLPKYSYLPDLNVRLAELAKRLDSPQQRVVIVNQGDGFDWHQDTTADKVHPNARGAEKMAACWLAALTQILEKPKQSYHPRLLTYKQAGDAALNLHVFAPPSGHSTGPKPAIVFFFGGGWQRGTPLQFYPECAHFAAKGLVAISADYRIAAVHRSTPFESVADGKSAIRWIRQHAQELGVDPHRIIAAGASAGGQIAAAAGTLAGLDEPSEDSTISSRPNAMILWYPVVDNGPDGYGYAQVQERYAEISPLHNIDRLTPPALFFLGTRDRLIPVKTAEDFKTRMEHAGGRCELKLFEGAGHPIYEYRRGASPERERCLAGADAFLASLGFLDGATANRVGASPSPATP
jgi:acetyl esterase/lipase